MSRPRPMSGFPELLPEQRLVELHVLDELRRVFELHGFAPVETRAVEPMEQLLRKGETSNEVYVLRRLQADPGQDPRDAGVGLHFDLTVPFARYVQEFAGRLEFPFRRYQIQKVWRGERPQEGRYREFTQADIDVVGVDTLPFHHDVEVARVMFESMTALSFLPPVRLLVNNRKVIEGFYRGIGVPDPAAVMRVVDKLDKLPVDVVAGMLAEEAGLDGSATKLCLELAGIRSADLSFVDRVRALGVDDPLLEEGLAELAAVVQGCASIDDERVTVEADLRIARGLDYYTGTVFETVMTGFGSLGSICSGGRYDALADDGRTTYPGVGISLGVTRMLMPLLADGRLSADRRVPSAVLVALPGEASRGECDTVAQQLRASGVACEVAAHPQRYGKQIRYAERRGIPYVWFPASTPGEPHEVKDIRSGAQTTADPATWRPAPDDLRPRINTGRA